MKLILNFTKKKAKKISSKLNNSAIIAMFFRLDAPQFKNTEKAFTIESNEGKDEILKWVEFCVKECKMTKLISKAHFIYALKDFIVGKSYDEIRATLYRVAREGHTWVGTGKRFFSNQIDLCYKSENLAREMKNILISEKEVSAIIA